MNENWKTYCIIFRYSFSLSEPMTLRKRSLFFSFLATNRRGKHSDRNTFQSILEWQMNGREQKCKMHRWRDSRNSAFGTVYLNTNLGKSANQTIPVYLFLLELKAMLDDQWLGTVLISLRRLCILIRAGYGPLPLHLVHHRKL